MVVCKRSPQLAVFTSPAVVTTVKLLLRIDLALTADTQTHSRHRVTASLWYLCVTLFAVTQALARRQLSASTLHGVFDARIDLVLNRPIFGPSTCHGTLLVQAFPDTIANFAPHNLPEPVVVICYENLFGFAVLTMPRVTEITDDNGNSILERAFSKEREQFGDLFNPTRVLAHCPPILRAAKQLYASIDEAGLLPASLLALVYTRVATINGCPF